MDSLVGFWTGWNNCDATPTVDTLPDRVNDGLRFVRFTYSGEAEFRLLKVIGGSHNWYQDSTTHDIDYFDEIHKFFLGGNTSMGFNDPEESNPRFDVWPNPATGTLFVRTSEPLTLTMYDSMGRSVMRSDLGSGVNSIDLQGMPEGLYVLVDGNGSSRKILRVK